MNCSRVVFTVYDCKLCISSSHCVLVAAVNCSRAVFTLYDRNCVSAALAVLAVAVNCSCDVFYSDCKSCSSSHCLLSVSCHCELLRVHLEMRRFASVHYYHYLLLVPLINFKNLFTTTDSIVSLQHSQVCVIERLLTFFFLYLVCQHTIFSHRELPAH